MQAVISQLHSLSPAVSEFSTHPVASWIGVAVVAFIVLGCVLFGPSFVRYMHIRNM
jgi:hypothetical protein